MSRDIETAIRRHLKVNDSLQPPIGLSEIVLESDTDVRSVPVPARGRGFGVLVAVGAAVVTLVLVGGVSLITRPQGSPVANSVTPPTLVTLPETVITTVPTSPDATVPPVIVPIAPIDINVEWTEVTEGNPPYAGPTDRSLGLPFVIDDGTTQRVAIVSGTDDTPYSLWTSEDGIEWLETALSLPQQGPLGGDLKSTPSGHWLIGRGPEASLWFSSDLVSGWEEIRVDGLTNETLYPLVGEPEIRDVATVGDTTLIAVQHELVFDWDDLLGIEPGTYDYYDYDYDGDEESTQNRDSEQLDPIVTLNGRVIREGADGEEDESDTLLHFIPSASSDGLTIIDADSGETMFEFPNHDAFDWEDVVGQEAWPRFETQLSKLLALTPDGVEAIGPWSSDIGASPSIESIRLIEARDGIIINGRDGKGQEESYVTRDGVSFEAISLPYLSVVYDEASGYFYTPYADPSYGVDGHSISPDGVNWTSLDTLPKLNVGPDVSTLSRVAGGWLFMKYTNSDLPVSLFSPDGLEWHPVDTSADVRRDFGLPLAWGNRLLILSRDSNWVGNVDGGDGS